MTSLQTESQPGLVRATEIDGAARGDTWSRRWLGRFHITGEFWVRAILWVSRGSGPRQVAMVWLWSTVFFFLLQRPRRIVARHLDRILGRAGFVARQRRIFRFFREHAWCLVERFEQFRPDFAAQVEFEGDPWSALLANRKGFLIATAHIGLWEIGQVMPMTKDGRRLHVVREREEHAATQRIIADLLAHHLHAHIVTHFLDDDRLLGASLLQALRRGDVVTLAADRARPGMVSLPALCFGQPVQMPAGPAALARAADVPIVPTFVYRTGRRRYRVVARPALLVPRTADRAADLRAAVTHLATEIEAAIRRDPYQWKRWEPLW